MTDLLNCPFCGGRGIPGTTLDNAGYVMCASETCWCMTGYLPTEAEAIAAWNTRPLSSDSASYGSKGVRGWLAEQTGNPITWACLNDDPDEHFTTNSHRAVRFARQEDAQAFIDYFGWTGVVAVEHMWVEARKHDWFQYRGMECCRTCGIVKNSTSDTRPCKGGVGVGLRALDSGTGGQQPVAEYDPDAPPDHSADNAADFIFKHLSDALEVNGKWSVSDGTETWDGDVVGTLYNILKAAGIWDEETNELTDPKAGVVSDEMAERLFQAVAPFLAGTAWREVRAALTAALIGGKS